MRLASDRRWLRLIALVAMAILVFAACGEDEEEAPTGGDEGPQFETLEEGVLQVGSCLEYEPFEYREGGELKGFDVELTEAIAGELGLEVKWVKANFDTIFTAVAGGQFDMVAAASTITPERDQQVDFSDPYFNARQGLAVNTSETPDIQSTDDLGEGDAIGVQKGTTGKSWATDNLADQGVEFRTYDAIPDAFTDLEAGNLDAVVNDELSSVAEVENRQGLEVVQGIDTGEQYGFPFSPDNPELREAVNGALADLIEDGTYASIFETYFPGQEIPPEYQPS
jgi:polar amino acid transport system substrate-binding protein